MKENEPVILGLETGFTYHDEILDNPLNKKLYPNRVPWEGFLVKQEFADKMEISNEKK